MHRELEAHLQVSPDSALQAVIVPLADDQDAVPEVLIDPGSGHAGTWRRQTPVEVRPPRYLLTP